MSMNVFVCQIIFFHLSTRHTEGDTNYTPHHTHSPAYATYVSKKNPGKTLNKHTISFSVI